MVLPVEHPPGGRCAAHASASGQKVKKGSALTSGPGMKNRTLVRVVESAFHGATPIEVKHLRLMPAKDHRHGEENEDKEKRY